MNILNLKNVSGSVMVIGNTQIPVNKKVVYDKLVPSTNNLKDVLRELNIGALQLFINKDVNPLAFVTASERKIVFGYLNNKSAPVDDVYQSKQLALLQESVDSIHTDSSNLIYNGRGTILDSNGDPAGITSVGFTNETVVAEYTDVQGEVNIQPSGLVTGAIAQISRMKPILIDTDFTLDLVLTIQESIGTVVGDTEVYVTQTGTEFSLVTPGNTTTVEQFNNETDVIHLQLGHDGTDYTLSVNNLTTGSTNSSVVTEALTPFYITNICSGGLVSTLQLYRLVLDSVPVDEFNMDTFYDSTLDHNATIPNNYKEQSLTTGQSEGMAITPFTLYNNGYSVVVDITPVLRTGAFSVISGTNISLHANGTTGALELKYRLTNASVITVALPELYLNSDLRTSIEISIDSSVMSVRIGGTVVTHGLDNLHQPLLFTTVGEDVSGFGDTFYGEAIYHELTNGAKGNIIPLVNFGFYPILAGGLLTVGGIEISSNIEISFMFKSTSGGVLFKDSTSNNLALAITAYNELTLYDDGVSQVYTGFPDSFDDNNWHVVSLVSNGTSWTVTVDGCILAGSLTATYTGETPLIFGGPTSASFRNLKVWNSGNRHTGECNVDLLLSDYGQGQYSSSVKDLLTNTEEFKMTVHGVIDGFFTTHDRDLTVTSEGLVVSDVVETDFFGVDTSKVYAVNIKVKSSGTDTDDLDVYINEMINGEVTTTLLTTITLTETVEVYSFSYIPTTGARVSSLELDSSVSLVITELSLTDIKNPLTVSRVNTWDDNNVTYTGEAHGGDIGTHVIYSETGDYSSIDSAGLDNGLWLIDLKVVNGGVTNIITGDTGDGNTNWHHYKDTDRVYTLNTVGSSRLKRANPDNFLTDVTVEDISYRKLTAYGFMEDSVTWGNDNALTVGGITVVDSVASWEAFRLQPNVTYTGKFTVKSSDLIATGIDVNLNVLNRKLAGIEKYISSVSSDQDSGIVKADHVIAIVSDESLLDEYIEYTFRFITNSTMQYGSISISNTSGADIQVQDICFSAGTVTQETIDAIEKQLTSLDSDTESGLAATLTAANLHTDTVAATKTNEAYVDAQIVIANNERDDAIVIAIDDEVIARTTAIEAVKDRVVLTENDILSHATDISNILQLIASDNLTLDTLQEVVDYIEINASTLSNLSITSIAGLQTALDNKAVQGDITNAIALLLSTPTTFTAPVTLTNLTIGGKDLVTAGDLLIYNSQPLATQQYVTDSVVFTNQYNAVHDADTRTVMSPLGIQEAFTVFGGQEELERNSAITNAFNAAATERDTAILLALNSFGLGLTTAPTLLTSLDVLTTDTGDYIANPTTLGTKPPGAGYGYVRITRYSATELKQEWTEVGTASSDTSHVYIRVYGDGTNDKWGDWVTDWNSDNLVKTQNDSDVTTGAILKVGDHGVGATSTPARNTNTMVASGTFKDSESDFNAWTDLTWLGQSINNGSGAIQWAIGQDASTVNSRMVIRHKDAGGTWSAITEMWSSGNLKPVTLDTDQTILNKKTFSKALGRTTHQTGNLVGGYDNIGDSQLKTTPIFTMGDAYAPNEETLLNMFGLGWSRGTDASFIGTSLIGTNVVGWGLYGAANGTAGMFLDVEFGNMHVMSGYYIQGRNVTDVVNAYKDGTVTLVKHPKGAVFSSGNAFIEGAIEIVLPFDSMIGSFCSFHVDVSNGDSLKSFSLFISGIASTTAGMWGRCTAILNGDPSINHTVRFGTNVNAKPCVWIGDPSDGWEWPRVVVHDVSVHHGVELDPTKWEDSWSINLVDTLTTVNVTRGNPNNASVTKLLVEQLNTTVTNSVANINANFVAKDASNHKMTAPDNLAIGWYTVAVHNTSEAHSRLAIVETIDNRKQVLIVDVTINYNGYATLKVDGNSTTNDSLSFTKVRIKSGAQGDGAVVQVLLDSGLNNCEVYHLGEDILVGTWNLRAFILDSINPTGTGNYEELTPTVTTDLALLGNGGIALQGTSTINNKPIATTDLTDTLTSAVTALQEVSTGNFVDLADVNPDEVVPANDDVLVFNASGEVLIVSKSTFLANTTTLINNLSDSLDTVGAELGDTNTALGLTDAEVTQLKSDVISINNLLLSDDSALDTIQEIVEFIELNASTLSALTIASIAGLQVALDNKADQTALDTLETTVTDYDIPTLKTAVATLVAGTAPSIPDLVGVDAVGATTGDLLTRKADGTYTHITREELLLNSPTRWEVSVGNMGSALGLQGKTYVQSLNNDNSPIGSTCAHATEFSDGMVQIHPLAPRMGATISTVKVIAGIASVATASVNTSVGIEIGIWNVSNNDAVVMHTVTVPVSNTANVGIFGSPIGDDSGIDIYAVVNNLGLVLDNNVRWGITFEPVDSDDAKISALGDYTILVNGIE